MFSKNIDPLPPPPKKNLSFNNTRLKDLKKKKALITSRIFLCRTILLNFRLILLLLFVDKHFPVVFLMISSAFYFLTQIIVLSLQSQTSCLEDSYCKST